MSANGVTYAGEPGWHAVGEACAQFHQHVHRRDRGVMWIPEPAAATAAFEQGVEAGATAAWERITQALTDLYHASDKPFDTFITRRAVIAELCDQRLDRSGRLLERVRAGRPT